MKVLGEELRVGDTISIWGKTKTISQIRWNNDGNFIGVWYVGDESRRHATDALRKKAEYELIARKEG
jgi:hypothetical protein